MKIIIKVFSFLAAVIIVFGLGAITAFAADEAPLETNDKGYPILTTEPEDGDIKWAWPLDGVYDSFRGVAYNLIMDTLGGSFKLVDVVTNTANTTLQKTPKEYQSSIFGTIDTVAKKVIMPIATVILTYVVLLDFMQNIMEKNNFHDFDSSVFIRWIIKTTVAIYFVSNATTIANAFFDVGNTLADNLISVTGENEKTLASAMADLGGTLRQCGLMTFLSMLIPIGLLNVISIALYMLIYVIMIGRMVEIYLHLSVAPIPLATITNREFGDAGKNYLKIIFAFILQMFFILLCICIYRTLLTTVVSDVIAEINVKKNNVAWEINIKLFEILAYGVVLVLTMLKSNSLAKSILGAR